MAFVVFGVWFFGWFDAFYGEFLGFCGGFQTFRSQPA